MSLKNLRPPTLKGTKGITTIHDLTWKLYPQYHTQEVITAHKIKYVGAIEPRKNLDTAIKIFYKLITNYQLPITHFLIIGKAGWKNFSKNFLKIILNNKF